jgi:glycosyltransferase involved in cell wall biosynthesis
MKIVQALGWYFPESLGGTETYVAALSANLRALGHEVVVTAPEPGESSRTYEHEGSNVFRYPIPRQPTRAECQGDTLVRGSKELHAWLRKEKPDVFHCHSLVTGLGLREIDAAKEAGARVVVTFHTPGLGYLCQRGTMMRWGEKPCDGLAEPSKCAPCDLQHRGLPRPLARLVGALPVTFSRAASSVPGLGLPALIEKNVEREKRLFERADAVVVLTDWARRAVEANVGVSNKLHLNRLGVASGRFARTEAARTGHRPLLGYLGRPDPIKGIWVLAQAISRVRGDLEFTLELRGAFRAEDVRRFQNLSKNDRRVRFEPAVSPADVPRVLSGYDVLICPSLALEGGPTVALEAHAVGTPVIGSRIGGLAEIVEDGVNGLLLPPGDAESLARAMESLLTDRGASLERLRRKFPIPRTMDDIVEDYLRIYPPCESPS